MNKDLDKTHNSHQPSGPYPIVGYIHTQIFQGTQGEIDGQQNESAERDCFICYKKREILPGRVTYNMIS
jgi:hypothetical protein